MEVALRCEVSATDLIGLEAAADVLSAALFDLGATAIGIEQPQARRHVLVAGFASETTAKSARDSISSAFSALLVGCSIDRPKHDWVTSQRAGLEPIDVGPWHIRAPWDPTPQGIESVFDIVIDPGRAFGHGAHPSTRLALELLIRIATSSSRVVDVGTGTGIIAIIAARLGIEVLAVENDVAALTVASKNIERNGATPHEATLDLITLVDKDASQVCVAEDDLVVANVTMDVHRLIAPVCRAADRLVVSGILCRQVAELRDLYPNHDSITVRTTGEWASAALVRRERSATAEAS